MANEDLKINIFPGINDIPREATEQEASNGSDFIFRFNTLIDRLNDNVYDNPYVKNSLVIKDFYFTNLGAGTYPFISKFERTLSLAELTISNSGPVSGIQFYNRDTLINPVEIITLDGSTQTYKYPSSIDNTFTPETPFNSFKIRFTRTIGYASLHLVFVDSNSFIVEE